MSQAIYVLNMQLYFLHPFVRGKCLRGVGKVCKRVPFGIKSVDISRNMALDVFYQLVVVFYFDVEVPTWNVFSFSEEVIDEFILSFEFKFAINLA